MHLAESRSSDSRIAVTTIRTLVDVARHRAREQGERVAFRFVGTTGDEQALTYAELDERARALAARLQAEQAPGSRALILHPPGLDYVIALLACFYAGIVAVPAYPPRRGRSLQRISAIVANARATSALTTAQALAAARPLVQQDPLLGALRWIASDDIDHDAGDYVEHAAAPADLALLQYTSGSTSTPKGVMVSHGNFVHNIAVLCARTRLGADDCVVAWLPPYHDMGLVGALLTPLYVGAPSVLLSPSSFLARPALWLEAIARFRGTVSGAPNFGYELCVRRVGPEQRAELDLRSWRVAFCGAERVDPRTRARFSEAFAESGFARSAFVPCYGLAEATLGVSFAEPGRVHVARFDARALAEGRAEAPRSGETSLELLGCGTPLEDLDVRVVDPETRRPASAGQVGEIWVSGQSVACGYWNDERRSAETFGARLEAAHDPARSYLRTGDLGFFLDDELFVTGRLKDLVIVGGINYYPEDIEGSAADCHPDLGQCAAFAVDSDDGEQLVVVGEVRARAGLDPRSVARALRTRVAERLELPVHDVVLVRSGSLPRTSSGKLQRSAARARYLADDLSPIAQLALAAAADRAPSELTGVIQAILADLLDVPSVAADDNLFALGGHSLLATQLVSRVRDALHVELPLRAVFDAPTPAALAEHIAGLPVLTPERALVPIDRAQELPLSFSQERMWLLHQLEPQGSAYNVAGAARIEGPLDARVLERALNAIVQRHEVLRSNFPHREGRPHVVVHAQRSVALPVADLRAEADPEAAALAGAAALASAPFEIASDALLRVALYRVAAERHVLAVCLHHLITDAWSMGILFNELTELYDLYRKGVTPTALPAGTGYIDFAHWQRGAFSEAEQAAQLAYWKQQLEGAPSLELPTDRPRSAERSSRGALLPLPLSAELLDAIRALATELGVTPFMVMLAAFELLLHRYTNQWDVVVGVPIAGRHRLASEPLIGTLVNTLALRLKSEPGWSFRELLAHVRDVSLEAHAHQDLPFERLVSELNLERLPGRSPLVDVMFDYQNTPMPPGRTETLDFEPVFLSRGAAQFDLSLLVLDTAFGRTAAVEYRTDLFEPATIERMLGHYASILASVVEQPDLELGKVPLLAPEERAAIVQLGTTAAPARPYLPVHALFSARAAEQPGAPAVSDANGTLSYADLERRSNALASELLAAGAGPGTRVAIYVSRSRHMLAALVAVLKTGAAYVPLDPLYPPARREFVLADCRPEIVLTERALRGTLPVQHLRSVVDLDDPRDHASAPVLAVNAPCAAAAPAYILYTSGSTGQPKGVEVSHGALVNFLQSMAHTPGISARDRLLALTTLAFDISGLELFLPLISGASVHIASSDVTADGKRLRELIELTQPSIVQATPSTWRLLLEAGFRGHASLTILCGGEAMDRELAQALLDRAAQVWNMYGPTETTIWSTVHRVQRGSGPVPIGRPIDATRVYILDDRGELAPLGVPGEICIAGAGVANGYFGRSDLTAERFLPDPFASGPDARLYRTGDRGTLSPSGDFYCHGRLDQQLKIRGYRIEPGEIEAALKQDAGVQDAVVIARQDRPGDVRLVAYYVAPSETQPPKLRAALQQRLPEYMVPSHFVRLPSLPQTPNGKINRAALPPPGADSEASSISQAPRDALESALEAIWCDVLHRARAGIYDNFFDAGGHSLLAVRLFARIEKELGAALSLSAFVQNPTIEALARQVRAQKRGSTLVGSPFAPPTVPERSFQHLVVVQAAGAGEPLFCVHGAGGNVLNMPGIARHLRKDRPFYAFKARGADGQDAPFETIEQMATAYLRDLRAVQPHGPYYLSGYCGGGIVAYEMARQLTSAGEVVALCALIDTYCPTVETSPERVAQLKRGIARDGARYLARRARARLTRDAQTVNRAARIFYHRARGHSVPLDVRDFWLTTAFFRAASRYVPGPYPGVLTVFRAEEVQPLLCHVGDELGWSGLALGGIATRRIPGNHDELSLEPNVAALAETLQRCVDAAAAHRQGAELRPGQ